MTALGERRDAGMAASKIHYADRPDVLWYAGATHSTPLGCPVHRGQDEPDRGQYDRLDETEFACGYSVLVRRRTAEAIGPIPEEYFLLLGGCRLEPDGSGRRLEDPLRSVVVRPARGRGFVRLGRRLRGTDALPLRDAEPSPVPPAPPSATAAPDRREHPRQHGEDEPLSRLAARGDRSVARAPRLPPRPHRADRRIGGWEPFRRISHRAGLNPPDRRGPGRHLGPAAISDTTINGVTFARFALPDFIIDQSAVTVGDASIWESPGYLYSTMVLGTSTPATAYASLSTDYQTMLKNGATSSSDGRAVRRPVTRGCGERRWALTAP